MVEKMRGRALVIPGEQMPGRPDWLLSIDKELPIFIKERVSRANQN